MLISFLCMPIPYMLRFRYDQCMSRRLDDERANKPLPRKSSCNRGLGLRNDLAADGVSRGTQRHLAVLICLDGRSDIRMLAFAIRNSRISCEG